MSRLTKFSAVIILYTGTTRIFKIFYTILREGGSQGSMPTNRQTDKAPHWSFRDRAYIILYIHRYTHHERQVIIDTELSYYYMLVYS
jgi:hypothetical protein